MGGEECQVGSGEKAGGYVSGATEDYVFGRHLERSGQIRGQKFFFLNCSYCAVSEAEVL